MERALFVAQRDDDETRDLLAEAGALASGVGAELVVLHVMPESEYEERAESRRESGATQRDGGEYSSYPITLAEEDAERQANRLAESVLDDLDLAWAPLGTVGREGPTILDIADEEGVDHIFVVGNRRSPSGKAIFGDIAQQLMIEFDGPVTTVIPEQR
jgi:nucleotide-binding universal stress UspA family protein